MAKLCKVFFFLIFQMTFEFTSSMYHIYRGDMDRFSRSIFHKVPKNTPCGDDGYCSCEYSETFTYGYDKHGHIKGECTSNIKFLSKSGCEAVSTGSPKHTEIQIVHRHDSFLTFSLITSTDGYRCHRKSTNYTISGDYENWMTTGSNPGSIIVKQQNILKLQIKNTSELLSMYPGMLLKLQIECRFSNGFPRFPKIEKCLLLKIEGKTNITTNLVPPNVTTFSPAPSTKISTQQAPEIIMAPQTGFNTKISSMAPKTILSTTVTPSISDPESDNRESKKGDSSSLVPILVPTLFAFVLIVVLFGIFMLRSRLRSSSASIKKDFHNTPKNISPDQADPTKAPQDSSQSYDTPESLIYTTPTHDAAYENTNVLRQSAASYYEFDDEDGYAACGDPRLREGSESHVGHISAQPTSTNSTTNVYENNDLALAPESTEKGNDNLGYLNHSLEKDASRENIYDRVAEDPQEPFYSVLEKPN